MFGEHAETDDILKMIAEVDDDENGEIDLQEFLKLMK
jgi:Ca2+-binding EF-hand superfamily protein